MPKTAKRGPLLAVKEATAIGSIIKLAAGDKAPSTSESAILTNPSKEEVKEKLVSFTIAQLLNPLDLTNRE